MKRILVTGTGGDVATGIVKCLLSDMPQVVLFSCDIKNIVPFLDKFETHFIIPRYDNNDYLSTIEKICKDYAISHFFPTTEPEILIADEHRDFFCKNNIIPIINNRQIIDVASSKYRTAVFLRKNEVCVPDTYIPDNLPTNLEYPFIVKPDFGRGSAHLTTVYTKKDLEKAISVVPAPVIQKHIGAADQEFTVGVFSDGITVRTISFRRTLGRGNMSVFAEVIRDKVLDDIAITLATLFDLVGSINIQLRIHNGKYCIFEINSRISSTVAFRHQMGFQDVIWWIQALSNELIGDYQSVEAGITAIKVDSEHIFYPPFNVQDRRNKENV